MEIIYLFDPLCGWCYGFGHHLAAFEEKHKEQLSFEVISGGMVTGSRVGPLAQMASYIKDSTPRLEALTGVKFGEGFLADLHGAGTTILDSTPPSKAFVILKEHQPEQQVRIAHALQEVFYKDGLDFNDVDSYSGICAKFGLDFTDFKEKFKSLEYQLAVKEAFENAAQYGVSGYPTVILRKGEQYFLMAHGFNSTEQLEAVYNKIVATEFQA